MRSEITHLPSPFWLTGITAQVASAKVAVASGASRNTPLLAPAGMIGSLKANLQKVGERLEEPERPDDVRPAPHLHRRPHLAVHEQEEGDDDEQHDEREHAPAHHRGEPEAVVPPGLRRAAHGRGLLPYSAALRRGDALTVFFSALISAMTADARAIGFVR